MKESREKILFYGEMGCAIHGISISNKINIEILKSVFDIHVVEENSFITDHDRLSVAKILSTLKADLRIAGKTLTNRYRFFYLVYSLSSFGCLKSFLAIIIYRLFSRGQVVLHIHRGDFFTRFYKSVFRRMITSLVFKLSKKIIVLSDKQKTEFESVFRRSFCVLHNTIETETRTEISKKQKFVFVYLSNYLEDKGIFDLLEAFKRFSKPYNNIKLETFGHFSDKKIQSAVMQYNSSFISINGPVYGKEKHEILAGASCLCLPSWSEGQPVVILESMFTGTPVIASSVGLIPEMLGEDYPFLTKPHDIESLIACFIKFLEYDNIPELSCNLTRKYSENYSKRKHSADLMEIFSQYETRPGNN